MATLTNTLHVPSTATRVARRVLRWIARGVGGVLILIAGLVLAGAGYEAIAAGRDAHIYPPPGQLVDVGGYRLHIHCVGTGSPTVVLDAGLGGTSLDWSLVQPAIGQTTRVCAYDRAGMGWSDPGPGARTPSQIAGELHTLLGNAGIAGPYVLVGHSLGGKNVRLFALAHPDEVGGMVLVDARGEYVDEHTSPAEAQAFQQAVARQGTIYGLARALGVARLLGASQWGPPALPAATRLAMALFATGQHDLRTTAAEAQQRAADDSRLQAAPALGATADRPDVRPEYGATLELARSAARTGGAEHERAPDRGHGQWALYPVGAAGRGHRRGAAGGGAGPEQLSPGRYWAPWRPYPGGPTNFTTRSNRIMKYFRMIVRIGVYTLAFRCQLWHLQRLACIQRCT